MIRLIPKTLFSTLKVSIEAIKKLREETSAPLGQCKTALE
jgi:translation elongation factor EF-Ts